MTENNLVQCSFCGSHKTEVKKLIVGEDCAICSNCIDLCTQLILEDEKLKEVPVEPPKEVEDLSFNALDVMNHLNKYVVGQHHAKKILSVAIVNHYKRINYALKNNNDDDIFITKGNILCVGPTGSGKTLLAKTVARYLDVPFVVADATTLTEAGYVGDDVESMISLLLSAAEGDIERAERGIVFVDEIDKIARKSESANITKDVSGEGVQQALLKLIEGSKCRVPAHGKKRSSSDEMVEIDTTNILFIAGGSFSDIERIIKTRIKGNAIGFDANLIKKDAGHELKFIKDRDLITYGMLPELMGRFTTVVALESLSAEELVGILAKVKNNYVDQYKQLLKIDGIELTFTEDALKLMAQNCLDLKIGARGLHSELERVLLPHMFYITKYLENNITEININTDLVNDPKSLIRCCIENEL